MDEDARRREELEEKKHHDEITFKLKNHRGYLWKQGHVVKNWKRRFFALKGDELQYFVDRTMTQAKKKGTILLKGAQVFEVPNEDGREQ
jgi:hypothetical protein